MGFAGLNVFFMFSMLLGGASDLLDLVPSSEYWSSKGAQVTPEFIQAELAPAAVAGDISKLVETLGEDDVNAREEAAKKIRSMGPAVVPQLQAASKNDNPEIAARSRRLITEIQTGGNAGQVRRLMAIRTAGEMKLRAALPRLKELTSAKEPFISDYATAAIAAIDGKPYVRPHPASSDDVWTLPAGCRAVVHVSFVSTKTGPPIDLPALAAKFAGAGNGNAAEVAKQAREFVGQIIATADSLGNVRIDGVTLGISGDAGANGGYVVAVVQGQYDALAAGKMLNVAMGGKAKAVAGVDVFEMANTSTAFPNNTHATIVFGAPNQPLPVEELLVAIQGAKTPLKDVPEMAQLLGQVDMKQPLWAAVSVTESYRIVPPLAAMESVTLVAKPKGEGIEFKFDAKSKNGPAMADTVAMVNRGVGQAKTEMGRQIDSMPIAEMKQVMQSVVKMMDTIKCQADEKDAARGTLTGEIEMSPSSLIGSMLGSFGGFSERTGNAPDVIPNDVKDNK